ncbi:MAG TPA: hypothetical protein VGR50_05990, partial [Terriglobales bacterium]|nr:hypothetical protein [Terriglobales bacterium]
EIMLIPVRPTCSDANYFLNVTRRPQSFMYPKTMSEGNRLKPVAWGTARPLTLARIDPRQY